MATRETSRFHIPYPGLDDQSNWDSKFVSMVTQFDATMFANMEHLRLVMAELPLVETDPVTHVMTQTGDLIFVSRTFYNTITVLTGATLALQADTMIGIRITSGVTSNQTSVWETVAAGGAEVDPDFQVLGYVDASFVVCWYNATFLGLGVPTLLFSNSAGMVTTLLSGAGNPNGVVAAAAGTPYYDTVAGIIYMNVDGAMTWILT